MAFRPNKQADNTGGNNQKAMSLTPEQAWEKIKPYCSYQERCHSEVKEKLYGYGLHRSDVEQLLSRLIEDNYLNEERFALSYAGGHFRIKKWGKMKIAHGLKQKGVSAYCIKKGLGTIDMDDYLAALDRLAREKWSVLKDKQPLAKKFKCRQYLLQKGFESALIEDAIKHIVS